MDTNRATWICPKCGTNNEEAYKFCTERACVNTKQSIEEIASASDDIGRKKQKKET